MNETLYKLIPLEKTQAIPINWEFTQDEYDKMIKGHRSNWVVFLRDEVVHFCRVGGEEFYRFGLNENADGTYIANALEAYVTEDFNKSLQERRGPEQLKQHEADFKNLVIEETAGLLAAYFGIDVVTDKKN